MVAMAPVACANARLSWISAVISSVPSRPRQRLIDERSNGSSCRKTCSPQKLVIRVLDPALAQHLIGEVVHVLEDEQTRHQAHRQGPLARTRLVDGTPAPLQKSPIDPIGQPHQRMAEIDDLVQRRPEQVLLPLVPAVASWHHHEQNNQW